MNDRIKLAEAMDTTRLIMAMGWTPAEDHSNNPEWRSMWFSPEGSGPQPRPNPYKDANFDYAVLEWAYGQGEVFALKFAKHLKNIWRYQIGDYARSALKEQEDD